MFWNPKLLQVTVLAISYLLAKERAEVIFLTVALNQLNFLSSVGFRKNPKRDVYFSRTVYFSIKLYNTFLAQP